MAWRRKLGHGVMRVSRGSWYDSCKGLRLSRRGLKLAQRHDALVGGGLGH